MIRNIFLNFVCWFLLACFILNTAGCIGDRISYPRKVRELPNTFTLSETWWGEKVVMVEVWGYSESRWTPAWQIKATHDVPVKGFAVMVGRVPEGFQ